MNVIEWLEFELGYHDSAAQRFNHDDTPSRIVIALWGNPIMDFVIFLPNKMF